MAKTMIIKGNDLQIKYDGQEFQSSGNSEVKFEFDNNSNIVATTQWGQGGMRCNNQTSMTNIAILAMAKGLIVGAIILLIMFFCAK